MLQARRRLGAAARPRRRRRRLSSTTSEIRSSFVSYFESRHGHTRVPASPLVPPSRDGSLLFTNAGMVQFKAAFAGEETRSYARAVTAQPCLRAGGKHNDLDNVGFTPRHHTLFEMLGNFSLGGEGGFFKEEAAAMAWAFLTEELGLPAARLSVTVHEGDDEAERVWRRVAGLTEAGGRLRRLGDEDNFWSMGDGEGPCGPCSEVFFDQGAGAAGGEEDRLLEVWNLVFMQHWRDAGGALRPLPRPCVDTGMGLERVAAVVQGADSNYGGDLMRGLVEAVRAELPAGGGSNEAALRVIADHARAATFLVAEGVTPAATGAGYVLRRIVRRAVRFAAVLGAGDRPLLSRMPRAVAAAMGGAYPGLAHAVDGVEAVLAAEEGAFQTAFGNGMRLLERHVFSRGGGTVPADAAFRLYDSLGFPLDLTEMIARERGWRVDSDGFERLMRRQRESSRAAAAVSAVGVAGGAPARQADAHRAAAAWEAAGSPAQRFTGYHSLREANASVLAAAGAAAVVDPCPFYAEGGGQAGDTGWLEVRADAAAHRVRVTDTTRPSAGGPAVLHLEGADEGALAALARPGARADASVDAGRRAGLSAHHTATHLLHAALRKFHGSDAVQAGSLVAPDRLRFDFVSARPLSDAARADAERWVNEAARAASPLAVAAEEMPLERALETDAAAHFGERYGSTVRVVTVPGRSAELCGGTHAATATECYPFRIVSEGSVAAGTRRVEARCGAAAVAWMREQEAHLARACEALQAPPAEAAARAQKQAEALRAAAAETRRLRARLLAGALARGVEGEAGGEPVTVYEADDDAYDQAAVQEAGRGLQLAQPARAHVLLFGGSGRAAVFSGEGGPSARAVLRRLAAADGVDGRGGGSDRAAQGVLRGGGGGVLARAAAAGTL